jgi:hypothetical protein
MHYYEVTLTSGYEKWTVSTVADNNEQACLFFRTGAIKAEARHLGYAEVSIGLEGDYCFYLNEKQYENEHDYDLKIDTDHPAYGYLFKKFESDIQKMDYQFHS